MKVKSIAECSKESMLQYFRPSLSYKLPFVIKTFVLILSGGLENGHFSVISWLGNPFTCIFACFNTLHSRLANSCGYVESAKASTFQGRYKHFVCLVLGFTSQSTAMVISRLSVHLTTLFPGQA